MQSHSKMDSSLQLALYACVMTSTSSHLTLDERRRPSRRFFCLVRRRSRKTLFKIASLILLLPEFQKLVRSLRRPRRFCAAPRGKGYWENEVKWNWKNLGEQFPDWEEKQYINHYRMTKGTFWFLCEKYGKLLQKETTRLRKPVPYPKRLAIVIHWASHSLTFTQLSALYAIAKSTAIAVVHEGITMLHCELVPESIRLPTGSEFDQVMCDFQSLCGLPLCAGALDGTFMKIRKPTVFGDTYYCYKRYTAIIVLGCVDARGIFTYVNAGRPGSVGDSYTYRHSLLWKKIQDKEWLNCVPEKIEGEDVQPYLVADSAFPLSSSLMKCYDVPPNSGILRPHK